MTAVALLPRPGQDGAGVDAQVKLAILAAQVRSVERGPCLTAVAF
jgi:hypothetical protein